MMAMFGSDTHFGRVSRYTVLSASTERSLEGLPHAITPQSSHMNRNMYQYFRQSMQVPLNRRETNVVLVG
jgi:hypothetical protein